MHTSRLAWEASWKEDLDKSYVTGGLALRPTASIASFTPASAVAHMNNDGTLMNLQREQRSICRLQEDLVREAAARFAADGLEREWLALTDERRREVVLEGICKTMGHPDMEDRRKWCPESTLHHLTSRGGKAYLDLLKAYIPADLDAPIVEPIQIPHPVMDRLFALKPADLKKPGMQTMVRGQRLSRAYCLSLVVWNILLTFYGRSENQTPVKPLRVKGKDAPRANFTSLGIFAPDVKEIKRQYVAQAKDLPYACSACGKHEKRLAPGAKLMACSKCRKMGRRVFYCSRECQVQDWRSGKPHPHKSVCGTPINEDTVSGIYEALQTTESGLADRDTNMEEMWFPPADSSFKRSPALLHQISRLKEFPHVDYMFITPNPHPDRGIFLKDPVDRFVFRAGRAYAFQTGDPEFVGDMYDAIRQALDANPLNVIDPADMKKQLEREFGITMSSVEDM